MPDRAKADGRAEIPERSPHEHDGDRQNHRQHAGPDHGDAVPEITSHPRDLYGEHDTTYAAAHMAASVLPSVFDERVKDRTGHQGQPDKRQNEQPGRAGHGPACAAGTARSS